MLSPEVLTSLRYWFGRLWSGIGDHLLLQASNSRGIDSLLGCYQLCAWRGHVKLYSKNRLAWTLPESIPCEQPADYDYHRISLIFTSVQ